MTVIEFKHKGAPQSEKDLAESFDEIRAAVANGGKVTDEQFTRVEADVKKALEGFEAARAAKDAADKALEIAKAASREGRTSDDSLERALRDLPTPYSVEKDEDARGTMSRGQFNVLAMTREELQMYLHEEAYREAIALRKLNDSLLTADVLLSQGPSQRAYQQRGGMKSLSLWKPYEARAKVFARALDTATSGNVSDWVPSGYTSERLTDVRDKLQLSGQLNWFPMPQNPFLFPVLSGFMTAYKVAESTGDADPATFTTSDPVSTSLTLTAAKLGTLTYWSREVDQDSIVPLLPLIDGEINYAIAYGWDQATVNGQGVAYSGNTPFGTAFDTGSVPGATDVRSCFDGLRAAAYAIGASVDFGGSLTIDSLAAMIGKGGKYSDPNSCFFATGYSGLARALVLKDGNGNAVYLTREKAGNDATLFSGQVGILMGYPLVATGVYPQNMNAAGIIDGAAGSNKTGMLFANKRMWVGGLRQSIQVDQSDHFKFNTDQRAVRSTLRVALKPMISPTSAKPFVIQGTNINSY